MEDEEDGLVLLALELLLDVGLRLTYITQSCVCVLVYTLVCVFFTLVLLALELVLDAGLRLTYAKPRSNCYKTLIKHLSNIYRTVSNIYAKH